MSQIKVHLNGEMGGAAYSIQHLEFSGHPKEILVQNVAEVIRYYPEAKPDPLKVEYEIDSSDNAHEVVVYIGSFKLFEDHIFFDKQEALEALQEWADKCGFQLEERK